MKCTVDGCTSNAVITDPVPLCAMDAVRTAAATEQALEGEAKMSRVMALTEIHASPDAADAELAALTGWPLEWVQSHRKRAGG
jgi:hypothetical protein